jgi:hypothetical protein
MLLLRENQFNGTYSHRLEIISILAYLVTYIFGWNTFHKTNKLFHAFFSFIIFLSVPSMLECLRIGVRRWVSKGVDDGRRPLFLRAGHSLKRSYFHFRGGPPTGGRRVGHGGPRWNFRESMATACHTPMCLRTTIKVKNILLHQP